MKCTINPKRILIRFLGMLLFVGVFFIASGNIIINRDEKLTVYYYDEFGNMISPQAPSDEGKYLFLPATANYNSLSLYISRGARVSSSTIDDEKTIVVSDSKEIDITQLFGEMKEGNRYEIHIRYNNENEKLYLMKSSNIPSLYISLVPDKAENSGLEYIHSDKKNYLAGKLVLIDGERVVKQKIISFKGRGNTTWTESKGKQPYNIKLSQKCELINGIEKAKDWCLLSNNAQPRWKCDRTGLATDFALSLYKDMGGKYAIDSQNVDLYIDGEYRGTYLLTEKVEFGEGRVPGDKTSYEYEDKSNSIIVYNYDAEEPNDTIKLNIDEEKSSIVEVIGKNGKTDEALASGIYAYKYAKKSKVKKTGDYLLETGFNRVKEDSWFITKRGVFFFLKEPQFSSKKQVQSIAIFVQKFENALFSDAGFDDNGRYYLDYIDISSFLYRWSLDLFLRQGDFMAFSTFFFVNCEEGVENQLVMAPAWDYDALELDIDDYFITKIGSDYGTAKNTVWVDQFLKRGDFYFALDEYNHQFINYVKSEIPRLLNQAEIIKSSQRMNEVLWDNEYDINCRYLIDGITHRLKRWENIWKSSLCGVKAISYSEGILVNISGEYDSVQWYKIDKDNYSSVELIPNAVDIVYKPEKRGIYLAAVAGKSIGYSTYSQQEPEKYVRNSQPTMVTEKTIIMMSNPISY